MITLDSRLSWASMLAQNQWHMESFGSHPVSLVATNVNWLVTKTRDGWLLALDLGGLKVSYRQKLTCAIDYGALDSEPHAWEDGDLFSWWYTSFSIINLYKFFFAGSCFIYNVHHLNLPRFQLQNILLFLIRKKSYQYNNHFPQ